MQKDDENQQDLLITLKVVTTTGVTIKDVVRALHRDGLQVNYVSKFPPQKHGAYVFRVEKNDRRTNETS